MADMTNWGKWCEDLKTLDDKSTSVVTLNKRNFICNCGLYDANCINEITGELCPLYSLENCRRTGEDFLDSEV